MNIVFYILVAIALFILYFLLSSLFGIIGRFATAIWRELKENVRGEEENE